MDINDFKTFLEVSRTRHFGQAAANLCVTQSTVSARIRSLEEQLGTPLFVRQRNNIQLTLAGQKMLAYAELITTAWTRARQDIGVPDTRHNLIVIGGMPSLWDISLQQWLQDIYLDNNNLIVNAEIENADVLHKRILNGTMDLAFVFDAHQHETFQVKKIADIKLMLVSSFSDLSAHDATREKYILVDWGTSFLTNHAQVFHDIPPPMLHIGLGRIALNFLLHMGGSAYIAAPMVDDYINSGTIYLVEDAPVFRRPAYAIYNNDNDKVDVIHGLLERMKYTDE